MVDNKRVAKNVKKLKSQKIRKKWKRDTAIHFAPYVGSTGRDKGRGKPLHWE